MTMAGLPIFCPERAVEGVSEGLAKESGVPIRGQRNSGDGADGGGTAPGDRMIREVVEA